MGLFSEEGARGCLGNALSFVDFFYLHNNGKVSVRRPKFFAVSMCKISRKKKFKKVVNAALAHTVHPSTISST